MLCFNKGKTLWGRYYAAPIYFYNYGIAMIHFWNVLFDGWLTNIDQVKKDPPKSEPKKENPALRLVPDGWKNLSKEKMCSLARDLTGEKYKSKQTAQRAIQKVLKRHS